jgi:hypothetical protein
MTMALTREQVEQACERIERALSAFGGDVSRVADLHEAWRLLQWLRDQYGENRELLDGCMDRLKACGEQLAAAVRGCRDALAGEYIRAGRAVQAWRDHHGVCRDLLAELATLDGLEHYDCPEGHIEVRRMRTVELPPAGSDERRELLEIVGAAGAWHRVTSLSRAKLALAIDGGLFPADQAARIAQLCPVRRTCRLLARRPDAG